jgi:hypothetical protein
MGKGNIGERAPEELKKISGADDLKVSPFREDGATYGTPPMIGTKAKEATMKIIPIRILQFILLIGSLMLSSFNTTSAQDNQRVVRMAKI